MSSLESITRRMRQKGSSAEANLGLPEYRGHSLAERIAFSLLVLFILAALGGVFGEGPLSEATVSSADGRLHIEYQRFCRRHAQQLVDITFPTEPGVQRSQLTINREYLQSMQVTEIFPEPLESRLHETGELQFATDGSGEPMTVRVHLEAQHAGRQEARLAAGPPDKRVAISFEQIVYP